MRQFAELPVAVLLIAVFSSSVPAQDKEPEENAAKASEVKTSQANILRISESRAFSADGGKVSGSLTLTVALVPDVKSAELLRVEVASAKDDQGNDLLDPKRTSFDARRSFGEDSGPTAYLRLEPPPRNATTISEISGTATFQDESKTVKPVELTDFKKTPGEYLENPALKKFGISVAYLDEETYDEKGSLLVMESMGLDKESDAAKGGGKEAAVGIMKAMFQLPGVTVLIIKDPDKKFLRVEGVAGDGEPGFHSQSATDGLWMLHSTRRDAELATIRIHVKSKQAEFTRTFSLKDVKLP